jgi:phosphomannomutase
MLLLLARHLLADQPDGIIVLEDGTSPAVARQLESIGGQVVFSDPRRSEMATAMREHDALLAGGPSRRFWHSCNGCPLPDALMTLTLLLVILSRSDRRLSEVLDREAALG